MTPLRRGEVWTTSSGVRVLIISSTVYNEIASEPTVVVVPVLGDGPDTGFGVDIGEELWAATGLVTSLRKTTLVQRERRIDIESLTDVNNMLFKILATPDR